MKEGLRAGTIDPEDDRPKILSRPNWSFMRFSRLCFGISSDIPSGGNIGSEESGVNSGSRIINPTGGDLSVSFTL